MVTLSHSKSFWRDKSKKAECYNVVVIVQVKSISVIFFFRVSLFLIMMQVKSKTCFKNLLNPRCIDLFF